MSERDREKKNLGKKRTKGIGKGNVQNSWFSDIVMLIA